MPEAPHPHLLRRDDAIQYAKNVYTNSLSLTQELSNYGSNLLVRCLSRKDRTLADVVVCGVLLKHVTAMVDSVQVLVSQGCTNAAFLVGRAAFESSIFIEWILLADTERKAQHYWVAHLRKQRIWARRCIAESEEFAAARNDLGQFGEDVLRARPMLEERAPEQLGELDQMLGSQASAEINKSFTEIKRKKNYKALREPHWHEPLGVKSLRDLSRQLQRLAEYEILYAKGSEKWTRLIEHGDKWKSGLDGARIKLRRKEDHDPKISPQPLSGIQGQSGISRSEGQSDASAASGAI